jgi:hypothetical protein
VQHFGSAVLKRHHIAGSEWRDSALLDRKDGLGLAQRTQRVIGEQPA